MKEIKEILENKLLLSKTKEIKGTRKLAREKALQILAAYEVSGTKIEYLFEHIFNREFNFGDDERIEGTRPLRPDEILELEADIPIIWNHNEIEYAKKLIGYVIDNQSFIDDILENFSENWDLKRINIIDKCLMRQTIIELIKFPDIPIKVSINEAIDIAKKYSTSKSSQFINGVIDTVIAKLRDDGLINKTGRGLINT